MNFFWSKTKINQKQDYRAELEEKTRQLESVLEVSNSVAGVIDVDDVLHKVIRELGQNLGYKFPAIFLFDQMKEKLVTRKIAVKASFEKLINLFFKKDFKDIFFPISEAKNILVKAALENKILTTTDLYDFARPFISSEQAHIMQKALNTTLMVAVPLRINNEVIGVLGASLKKDLIDEGEKKVLETFASQISIAIYNSQLFEQVKKQITDLAERNKQLEIISNFTNKIISTLEVQKVAQSALDSIPDLLGYSTAAYLQIDTSTNLITPIALSSNDSAHLVEKYLPKKIKEYTLDLNKPESYETLVGKAIKNKTIEITDDFRLVTKHVIPDTLSMEVQKIAKIKTIIAVPVKSKNQIIGIIQFTIMNKYPNEISQLELETLTVISNQIGIALENAQLYEQTQSQNRDLEARNKQLQIINQFTNKIISTLKVDEVAQNALDSIPEILGYLGALYSEYNPETNSVKTAAFTRNKYSELGFKFLDRRPTDYELFLDDPEVQDSIVVKGLKEGKVYLTDDFNKFAIKVVPKQVNRAIQKALGVKTVAAVPIKSKNKVVGLIDFIIQNKAPNELTQIEIDTMIVIANQIGTALDNAYLYAKTQKALTELELLYRQNKDMLDILGHELRTPAGICKGNLELAINQLNKAQIQPKEIGEKIRNKLTIAYESIIKEAGLITSLLSATKLDSGQLVIVNQTVNLYEIARSACKSYQDIAKRQNLELRFIEPANPIPTTIGDSIRLSEVMDNLLSNAVKYTKEGYIEVFLHSDKDNVYVNVRDTGNGISEAQMPQLFNKFKRLNNYLDESHNIVRPGGTGLGLYVSKGIIDAHNGKIWVESKGIGKGSTFTFSLPIRDLATVTEAKKEEKEVDMIARLKGGL